LRKDFYCRDEIGLLISSFSSAAVQDDPLKKVALFLAGPINNKKQSHSTCVMLGFGGCRQDHDEF
jgi:hypothetical protein